MRRTPSSSSVLGILIAVVVLALLPALGVIFYTGVQLRAAALANAQEQARSELEVAVARLQSVVDLVQSAFSGMAAQESVIAGNPSGSSSYLAHAFGNTRLFTVIVLADPGSGDLIAASTGSAPGTVNYRQRRWFKQVLANHRFSVGEYVLGSLTSRPAIHFAAPVYDASGKFVSIICVGMDLERLREYVGGVGFAPDASLVISDHAGTVLVSTHDSLQLGQPDPLASQFDAAGASPVALREAGRRMLAATVTLPGGDVPAFRVRLAIPVDRYEASAHRATLLNALGIGIAGMLATLIAWWVGRRLLSLPIVHVAKVADAIAAGDIDRRVGAVYHPFELDLLARSFDSMADKQQALLARLRASELDLQVMMQSIGEGVIATDESGKVVRMNRAAEALTGWSGQEATGKPLSKVFHIINTKTRQPVENPLARAYATGEVVGLANRSVLISRKGEERDIADSTAPIRYPDGSVRGVVLVFQDITAAHRMEAQLQHSLKLEAVGQLAGGIAHDINNLLVPILASSHLALDPSASGDEIRESARMAEQCAHRAADLTRKLLTFARRTKREETEVDLHSEVRSVIDLLERTIDKRITITTDLKAVSAKFLGDPAQIQSAILNLALNARDAMPTGGELVFATRNILAPDPMLAAKGLCAVPHLALSVKDTGCGIPEEVRNRLFEPFVTTKEVGKGTGLGLASAYGTVKAHEGAIDVQTETGRGTCFTLYFPQMGPQQVVVPATQGTPLAADLRGRSILVADDEPSVRKIIATILRRAGAVVTEVSDGRQAVAAVQAKPEQFDLAVLDYLMPEMTGVSAFMAIREIRASLPCFLMSGNVSDAEVAALMDAGLRGFLAKPCTKEDLLRLLVGV